MRVAIITSQTGQKGSIQDPVHGGFPHVKYVAFTDKPLRSQVWECRPTPAFSTDCVHAARRHAKLAKMLAWMLVPGYDYYIWHDSTSEVHVDPVQLIHMYLGSGQHMAAWHHAERDCAYAEAEKVIKAQLDHVSHVQAAVQFLRMQSYPEHNGLYEMSAFIYRNTLQVQQALLTWWELTCKYSSRDQILFPYVVHMHKLQIQLLPGKAMRYAGNNTLIPQVR